MRVRVCDLQLLLELASAVFLGPEYRGTHDHILLPPFWDSPNLEVQLYPRAPARLFVTT
jgi:hypothetical protein